MKRKFMVLGLAAAAAVVALAGLELFLRATGFSSPAWYQSEPVLGWTLRPGASGWFSREGRAFVQVNSAGQRDREHTLEKPAGVYRIAVVGDAYAEAMQVPMESTYWAQLPRLLEGCGFQQGKRIETLNFGVRDYGTAQIYLALERTAIRYAPDLVLLQFDHDVRDNSPALDSIQDRPFFRLDANGALRLETPAHPGESYVGRPSTARNLYRTLVDRSRALQLALVARERLQVRFTSVAHAKSESGNEAGLDLPLLAPPRNASWDEAWRVTEALIAKTGEFASRHGAAVAVFTVPFALEAHPDAALRQRLQAKYGVADFTYSERRVVAFAREKGMLGIMLGPAMQARATASGAPLYGFENRALGFGHWNEQGHRTAAEVIARELCASRS
ncbi:MAG: hypothetical protein ACJ8G5_18620 [Burkholderiales bacterium]